MRKRGINKNMLQIAGNCRLYSTYLHFKTKQQPQSMKKMTLGACILALAITGCDKDGLAPEPMVLTHSESFAANSTLADTTVLPDGRRRVITERVVIVYDTTYLPPAGQAREEPLVFLGSSSFTLIFWKTQLDAFREYNPVNVSKGGWQCYNVDTAITLGSRIPANTKQVVVGIGENDIYDMKSRGKRFYVADFMYRWKAIPRDLRRKFPQARVTFTEIKKTPDLKPWWGFVDSCNTEIRKHLAGMSNASWVPINDILLQSDYLTDGSHVKSAVYPAKIEPRVEQYIIR